MEFYISKLYTEDGDKLVDFKTANLALEKGYNERKSECFTKSDSGAIFDDWTGLIADGFEFICYRPTQSVLQKWLRDIHNIKVECIYKEFGKKFFAEPGEKSDNGYYCMIKADEYTEHLNESSYNIDYELSLEIGLIAGLNLIKIN